MTAIDHRTHGLAGNDIVPDWPPLQTTEVHAVLSRFPALRGPFRILWHSPRPLSAAARVQTATGEIFVKRHHRRIRTPATLTEEHAFIAHLRAHGIPIPEVLSDADGRSAMSHGDWTYEVHTIADGVDVFCQHISWAPLTDLAQARTAGRMLAHLHQAAASYHAPQRDTWMLVARDDLLRAADPIAALQSELASRPALAAWLQQRNWQHDLTPLVARQQTIQARVAQEPVLWTHNDWHVSNLCWSSVSSDASITSVFDFGLASPTFALYDLATAIERNAIAWLHLERGMQAIFPDTARALIEGYTQVLSLTAAQRELLALLLPVIHLDFALSEVEYFYGVTQSAADADVAWHTFLLGHAAWFDTPPGRAFLDSLRITP